MSIETVTPLKLRRDKSAFMANTGNGEEWYGFSKFDGGTPLTTDMTPIGKPVIVDYRTSRTGAKYISKVSYPSGFPSEAPKKEKVAIKGLATERPKSEVTQTPQFLPNDPVRIHVSGILQAVIRAIPYNQVNYVEEVERMTRNFLNLAQFIVDEKHGVKKESVNGQGLTSDLPVDF